jgi:hypothetical protein
MPVYTDSVAEQAGKRLESGQAGEKLVSLNTLNKKKFEHAKKAAGEDFFNWKLSRIWLRGGAGRRLEDSESRGRRDWKEGRAHCPAAFKCHLRLTFRVACAAAHIIAGCRFCRP